MTRYIDADALDEAMYHKSFEVDDGRTRWNSGCWIRYRIYEEASREAPTVDAIPVEWITKYVNKSGTVRLEQDIIREMVLEWIAERKEE